MTDMPPAPDHRPPLTIAEAAEYLRVSPRFIRRLLDEHQIPYLRFRALIRLRATDLDAYLNGAVVAPADDHMQSPLTNIEAASRCKGKATVDGKDVLWKLYLIAPTIGRTRRPRHQWVFAAAS